MYISRVLFSDQINARAFRTVVVYTKNNTSLSTFSRGPEDTSHDPFYKTLNSYESHVRIMYIYIYVYRTIIIPRYQRRYIKYSVYVYPKLPEPFT